MKSHSMPPLDFLHSYGPEADRVSLPLGGLGAGMMSFAHNGALESVSIQHHAAMYHSPDIFASVHCRSSKQTRVLQSQVPHHKVIESHGSTYENSGNGSGNHYGLPCYRESQYAAAFPFAEVALQDESMPVQCKLTAWSPFIPGDDVNSGLPVAILEYTLHNSSEQEQELVFGFHSANFLNQNEVFGSAQKMKNGFYLESKNVVVVAGTSSCCPQGQCGTPTDTDDAKKNAEILYSSVGASIVGVDNCTLDCGWFRGGWFDTRGVLWDRISSGEPQSRDSHGDGDDPGASLASELTLAAGASRTITVIINWYTPEMNVRPTDMKLPENQTNAVRCWYGQHFDSLPAINTYVTDNLESLRKRSVAFAFAMQKNDMPESFRSAVSRNLAILKSPSLLRVADGTIWGWEGCHDDAGCCEGTCTHVYNYAQAIAFLFPDLERQMRDVEFGLSQTDTGYQYFRATLPFDHQRSAEMVTAHPAADGQLGGLIRVYREWTLSGDSAWLTARWPTLRQSLEYCIRSWDPQRDGHLAEPHHNTYDIEFWGEDGLCSCMYAGALTAAIAMAEYLNESVHDWPKIRTGVQKVIAEQLFDEDGWIKQNVRWKDVLADDPYTVTHTSKGNSREAIAVIEKEGPRHQYGGGVLIDAVLGCQLARIAGLGAVIDPNIEAAHIDAIMKYNFKPSLREHACTQRPAYAIAEEAGTVMCTWPNEDKTTVPFPYSSELWSGCEHQFAAHLCMLGRIDDAIAVESAICARYDGRIRNPFNEIECGHFYVRALASYGLVPAFSGARYNAITQIMELQPSVSGDFTSFFAIGTAWGQIGVRDGAPFLDLIEGELPIQEWRYILKDKNQNL